MGELVNVVVELVKYLVEERGVDVETKDEDNTTPAYIHYYHIFLVTGSEVGYPINQGFFKTEFLKSNFTYYSCIHIYAGLR
jgi:hypothetical protein